MKRFFPEVIAARHLVTGLQGWKREGHDDWCCGVRVIKTITNVKIVDGKKWRRDRERSKQWLMRWEVIKRGGIISHLLFKLKHEKELLERKYRSFDRKVIFILRFIQDKKRRNIRRIVIGWNWSKKMDLWWKMNCCITNVWQLLFFACWW